MELRKLIRTTIENAPRRAQVTDIAAQVIGQLSDEDKAEALQMAMVELVRQEFGHTRKHEVPLERPSNSARSWKTAAIREAWKQRLEAWYTTTAGERARLADLTRDEVLHNVTVREDMARANLAEATELRRIADLMAKHKVARVGDLPENVLRPIFTEAAA